jgi:hypothetical protein
MRAIRSERERIERKIHILEVDYSNLDKGAHKKLEQIKTLKAKLEKIDEGEAA